MENDNKVVFLSGYLVKIWTAKSGKRYAKVWDADSKTVYICKVAKSVK